MNFNPSWSSIKLDFPLFLSHFCVQLTFSNNIYVSLDATPEILCQFQLEWSQSFGYLSWLVHSIQCGYYWSLLTNWVADFEGGMQGRGIPKGFCGN